MIRYAQFFREYIVRRTSDLEKINKLALIEELPATCVLHTDDNFNIGDEIKIQPELDNPLAKLQPEMKHLFVPKYEQKPTDAIVPDTDHLKVITTGVLDAIMKFREENSRRIKIVHEIEQLPSRPGIQAWMNYNTLHHVRLTGRLPHMRTFNFVMANIINHCNQLPERDHFIHIPLTEASFSRSQFVRVMKELSVRTLFIQNSSHFLFLVHLLSMFEKTSEVSMFRNLSETLTSKLNFVLTFKDNMVIYNLGALLDMSKNASGMLMRILNQVNTMCVSDSTIVAGPELVDPKVIKTPLEWRTALDGAVDDIKAGKPLEHTEELAVALKKARSFSDDPKLDTIREVLEVQGKINPEPALAEAIEKVTKKMDAIKIKNAAGFHGVPAMDHEEVATVQSQQVESLIAKKLETIENDKTKSPAQKARLKEAVMAFKSIKISDADGDIEQVAELLKQPPPSTVDDNHLDHLKDEVLDKSMLKSSITNFDHQYMKKAFKRDLARTLMSFEDMHLVELNTERVDDPLNRLETYTAKYVDNNLVTHTIKFTLPIVDENGICLINGTEKSFTKQRVNIPICKVSPTRVALTSNQNKSLVDRHDTVANSFYPYVNKMLVKGGFEVQYISAYPIVPDAHINFPKEELASLRNRYNAGRTIFTHRVDADYERYKDPSIVLLDSVLGEFEVVSRKTYKNIKESDLYDQLSSDQKKALLTYDKVLLLELRPTKTPTILPFEYTNLATKISSIKKGQLKFSFNYHTRLNLVPAELLESVQNMEANHAAVFVGVSRNPKYGCFLLIDGTLVIVDLTNNTVVERTTLINEIAQESGLKVSPLNEWLDLKILNKSLPLGFVFSYRFGLLPMLEYMNVHYEIMDANTRADIPFKPSDLVLRFADKQIAIRNPKIIVRLIFSGLNHFNLRNIYLESMAEKDPYYDLIQQKKLSVNYLKGVDTFFDRFIDPLTEDILRQLGEPTNMRDLLIRAATMLTTEDHNSPSASSNTMIRSYNRMVGTLYNEMARAYETKKYGAIGSSNKFSINPSAVFQRVLGDQLMSIIDTINPIQCVKDQTNLSHMGDGGRSADTFMIDDRNVTEDNIGIISEATMDSSRVGINAYTSMDPNLKTLSGLGAGIDPEEIEPTQLLSVTGVLVPGVTHDD